MNKTVPPLKTILEDLGRAEEKLIRAAEAVPANQWKTKPEVGRWSAGEVISHLITVERAIISRTDKALRKPPKKVPFFKRLHVPMAVAKSRLIRFKTPIPLDLEIIREKEEMLEELRQVRARTLLFIKETMDRDLSKYRMSHPFLGSLDTYEWFHLIASHEIRHTKQLREIAHVLRKTVTSSQK